MLTDTRFTVVGMKRQLARVSRPLASLTALLWIGLIVRHENVSTRISWLPERWLVAAGVLSTITTVTLFARQAATTSTGWVSSRVREIVRAQLHTSRINRFRDDVVVLATWPTRDSLNLVVLLVVCAAAALLGLSRWSPVTKLEEPFYVLWTVQAAVAGIALPVLVFIIELAKDDRTTGERTAEILIRHTWVFPIMGFSLLGLPLFGVIAGWFQSGFAYEAAFTIHAMTVTLVVLAYWRALSVLFDRQSLRKKSIDLLVERVNSSLDQRVERRIGSRILVDTASALGLDYRMFGPNPRDSRWIVLEASAIGILDDVNLWYLEAFVGLLPWKQTPDHAGLTTQHDAPTRSPRSANVPTEPALLLLKTIGGWVSSNDRGLIALEASRFDPIDRINKRLLETRLQSVFSIEDAE
jgi:hypothetical protein